MAKKQKISLTDQSFDSNPFGELSLTFDADDIARGEEAEQQIATTHKPKAIIRIRLEKSGRGGKTVTVLYDWENLDEQEIKQTFKKLKKYLATGGSQQEESLEFQGDQRQKTADFLKDLNIQVKGQVK